MQIYLDSTPYKTNRLWLYGLSAIDAQRLPDLNAVESLLNAMSCWGGADSRAVNEDCIVDALSWELPAESAQATYTVVKTLLTKQGFTFTEGYPK
jgi:hypothetical protein